MKIHGRSYRVRDCMGSHPIAALLILLIIRVLTKSWYTRSFLNSPELNVT